MPRVAFRMKLFPGQQEEYRRRHAALWPELARALREAGISDYSIFLDEATSTLFAVQRQGDPAAAEALAQRAVMRRWWDYMADIMETHPDHSPVCGRLEMLFHFEA